MIKSYFGYYESEIGIIEIMGTEDKILAVEFVDRIEKPSESVPVVKECLNQIDQYFRGQRKVFSIPLQLQGTNFQKRVWEELMKIPFGATASYKDIAVAVGRDKAVRAVGNTNRLNRISIIIPCHRVIGIDGSLTGYGGGLWRKGWLLKHEQKFSD